MAGQFWGIHTEVTTSGIDYNSKLYDSFFTFVIKMQGVEHKYILLSGCLHQIRSFRGYWNVLWNIFYAAYWLMTIANSRLKLCKKYD